MFAIKLMLNYIFKYQLCNEANLIHIYKIVQNVFLPKKYVYDDDCNMKSNY